jgi:hypothetical protein
MAVKPLRLAEDLSLPIEAAGQTFLVVGKRGSGKSTTCVRLAEQLYTAGVPFVVIDPVDNWHGLKSSRDGKSPGLSVYVFGGSHADLPLESTAGALMADVLVEHRISAVLAVKHFSGRERGRFVADFAQRLFQRNREPLHVFLEEAHEVAPQNPYKGEEEMLGHVARIWKLGRSSGLGGSAITQRPASLSKNITTQAEILIVHRTLGPQDVAAIREWIRYHGEREDILAQLATLKTGEAFVWAPDFPEGRPIGLTRVRILQRETFDSAASPKAGERRAEPKALAPVDLQQLGQRMAATIEKAKAEDPRELRRRIAELEAQLRKKGTDKIPAEIPRLPKRVEVPVLKDAQVSRLEKAVGGFHEAGNRLHQVLERVKGFEEKAQAAAAEISGALRARQAPPLSIVRAGDSVNAAGRGGGWRPPTAVPESRARVPSARDLRGLGLGERRILTAVAQHQAGVTREQLTVLTGYKRSSRDTYLQRLRERVFVELAGDTIQATAEGAAALGPNFQPLPTGLVLQRYWMERLPAGEKAILGLLLEAYPKPVDRERISEATEYQRSSRDTYLQRLRSRQLVVDVGRGQVRASDALF